MTTPGDATERATYGRCDNGHPFVPGHCEDTPAEGDPRWCDTCGEVRVATYEPKKVTLLGAVRAGWHWRNIWTCFGSRKHLPCGGCTPRCGLCAWCYKSLAGDR